jgi:putative transposase
MERQALLEPNHQDLSIRHQCHLLSLNRSSLYYESKAETPYNLSLMKLIDEEHTRHPFKGALKMTVYLEEKGYAVNVKRVRRLLRMMGLEAIYPKKNLSQANIAHKKYPYLLKDVEINHKNQVWSTDITYVRLSHGFMYLIAVIDWYSRYVLSWKLSNSLDASFCIEALEDAILYNGLPEIFNTDQGAQFTSEGFISILRTNGIKISMDGKGRVFDNIFIERLWRSVKYEEVYLHDYANAVEAKERLSIYFKFYNYERHHQSLDYKKPAEVYFGKRFKLNNKGKK